MSQITNPEIESYCVGHTTPLPAVFGDLRTETYAKTTAPQMQVGVIEGSFLKMLVALSGARRILELGTFTGYSSLAMAQALPADGKIITCDINPETTAIAREFWQKAGVAEKIELRLGPGLETIVSLSGELDMVFIDADKNNYVNYWEACLPKLRRGGLIVVDNVLWSGAVLNPQAESDHHIVRFNEHAKRDPRVEHVMLPIRDGMLLARKL